MTEKEILEKLKTDLEKADIASVKLAKDKTDFPLGIKPKKPQTY